MAIEQICPENSICHVYATLPEETATSVFINVHSGIGISSLTAIVRQNETKIVEKDFKKIYEMKDVESIGQRNVHSILLKGLIPNMLYNIDIINTQTKTVLKTIKYKTVPDEKTDIIKMAIGGDLGMTKNG
jgi:hypothetical protein